MGEERKGIRREGKGGEPKVGSHPDVRDPAKIL